MKLKDWKTITVSVVLLLGVLIGAGYAAKQGYSNLRQKRLVNRARLYLDKAELKKAYLSLQGALRSDPKNLEACRLMAQLAEAEGSPAVLIWRSRVVELAPKSTTDRLALAQTAMALRDPITATNALEGVVEADKKTVGYLNVAGSIAAAMNEIPKAEGYFLEAARVQPTNPVPRLNLAVVHLQTTNAASLESARATLNQLRSDPNVRIQATRELLGDAIRHNWTNDAFLLVTDLVQLTNATFQDRVMHLQVLRGAKKPEFTPALAQYRQMAATNPANLYQLASWQMAGVGPAENLKWLRSLSADVQTNLPGAMLIADCLALQKDWRGMQSTLTNQNWAELDLLRHALLAKAMREQNLTETAKTEWEMALKAAGGRKQPLVMLLRIAAQWRWFTEAEDILWTIVNQNPNEKWAATALAQALYYGGRTRSLLTLYSQQLKRSASDLNTKNNLAMTALLLQENALKPHDLAREAYEKAPTNSSYASTYAFSLFLQNKPAEAIEVFRKVDPKHLDHPSLAGYYALALKATGHTTEAEKYFAIAGKAPMLPEEKKIFEKSRSGT